MYTKTWRVSNGNRVFFQRLVMLVMLTTIHHWLHQWWRSRRHDDLAVFVHADELWGYCHRHDRNPIALQRGRVMYCLLLASWVGDEFYRYICQGECTIALWFTVLKRLPTVIPLLMMTKWCQYWSKYWFRKISLIIILILRIVYRCTLLFVQQLRLITKKTSNIRITGPLRSKPRVLRKGPEMNASFSVSLKFVSNCFLDNKPALEGVTAWSEEAASNCLHQLLT